jgi:5-methylthioadenosine/S-adenosylhomocysteine deaminase
MGAGAAVQAIRDLGLRHIVSLTITDRNYEDTIPLGETAPGLAGEIKRMSANEAKSSKAWLDECAEFIETFHAPAQLTIACPGPSAVQRCTDALLAGAAELAAKNNLPLHIHLAETKAQALQGRTIYGHSLLRHLESLGILGTKLSCAHSIWIEDEDVALFARRGVTAVHNPASNLRIGSGLARVKEFLAAGVNVALGTDGAASNDGQNMFDAVRLTALIHNQAGSDFNQWITPIQAVAMATRNGARAFDIDAGVLAPGRLADLVLLRRDTAAFTPLNDAVGQIVFCENGGDVDTVIVNGEIVVERGCCTKVDEKEILSRAIKARERLDPAIQRELAAAGTMEPALAAMYFKVFGIRGD